MLVSKKLEKTMSALGEPTRLGIMLSLHTGPKYVGQLKSKVKVEPTLLSHHLKTLKDAGLIVGERIGKRVRYQKKRMMVSEQMLTRIFD